MNKSPWLTFASRQELDHSLAMTVAGQLAEAIKRDGKAVLVVSGGTTPRGFFHELSQQHLEWSLVTVTLADERWLAVYHADSNERLVRENLLINEAASASFVSLVTDEKSPFSGANVVEQRLASLGKFTVVILGVGEDGHTASLFPQAVNLRQGLDITGSKSCIAIDPVTAPYQRISMTLPRLLNSEQIIIHITGETKKQLLEDARISPDKAGLPINVVLQQGETPVSIYWAP